MKARGCGLLFVLAVTCAGNAWCESAPAVKAPQGEKGQKVTVVGCPSDGQTGPVAVPDAAELAKWTPKLPQATAQKLAYYRSADIGVLAPRGWHCFGLYGSNGSMLIVAPEALDANDFFGAAPRPLTGPAVQVAISDGDTSGRFEVARIAARLFPKRMDLVQAVIDEGAPASDYPTGPFAGDIIKHRDGKKVVFETPADREGMGTMSRLQKNAAPIDGVAMLAGDNALMMVARVPKEFRRFFPVMVGHLSARP